MIEGQLFMPEKGLTLTEIKFYFSNASVDTPLIELVYLNGTRWPIETIFDKQKAKSVSTITKCVVGSAGITIRCSSFWLTNSWIDCINASNNKLLHKLCTWFYLC